MFVKGFRHVVMGAKTWLERSSFNGSTCLCPRPPFLSAQAISSSVSCACLHIVALDYAVQLHDLCVHIHLFEQLLHLQVECDLVMFSSGIKGNSGD